MFKVIGIEKREGVYKEKPYCNFIIYAESDRKIDSGIAVDQFKINKSNYENILLNHKLETLDGFKFNQAYYDVFQRVVDLV